MRIGIAADEVVGTYSVIDAEDLLEQAPENVPHCIGMLATRGQTGIGDRSSSPVRSLSGTEYLKIFG